MTESNAPTPRHRRALRRPPAVVGLCGALAMTLLFGWLLVDDPAPAGIEIAGGIGGLVGAWGSTAGVIVRRQDRTRTTD